MTSHFKRLVIYLLLSFAVFSHANLVLSAAPKHDLCQFAPVKRLAIEVSSQNIKSAFSDHPAIANAIANKLLDFIKEEQAKLDSHGVRFSEYFLHEKTGYESDKEHYSCTYQIFVGLDASQSDVKILDAKSQSVPTYRPRFFAENPQARRGQIAFIQYDIHLAYMPDYRIDYISIKKIDLNFVPSALSEISMQEARMRRLKQQFSRRVVVKAREIEK